MSEWIKCSERLPEYGMNVIASGPSGVESVTVGSITEKGVKIAAFFRHDGRGGPDGYPTTKTATHWQPLPPPPRALPEQDHGRLD